MYPLPQVLLPYLPSPRWGWWWPSLMLPCEEDTVLLCWWSFLGVELKIPDKVEPKMSWWWPSWWCCCRDAINSATGGRGPVVVEGCGPILKPFMRRLSFWRFFFPPVPRLNRDYITVMYAPGFGYHIKSKTGDMYFLSDQSNITILDTNTHIMQQAHACIFSANRQDNKKILFHLSLM